MVNFWVLLFYCLFYWMSAFTAFRNVVSIGNTTLSSEDIESNSEPLDVRHPLTNNIDLKQNGTVELVSSISSRDESAWTIHFLIFISIIACAVSALLAIGYYLEKWRERTQLAWMANAMQSLNFTAVVHDDSTSTTCSMCLEDYKVAEKLRVLPCHHMFHADCVDQWLVSFRTTCPVCRGDVSQDEVTIEQIRTIENITADLQRNANRLVNRYFLLQAGIFFCATWDLQSKYISWIPLILSLIASFRLAYAFPLMALDLQSRYDEIDTIKGIDDRVARYFRIWRFCLVTCFISLAIAVAVGLPIALVNKSAPAVCFVICFKMMVGTYIIHL